jgi:tRNA(Ile)-lysidine synthase
LIHVKPQGDGGPEQAAREARYRIFTKIVSPGDQLLLAHHADDQVETFLLRLLRGAGVLGLGAMREIRPLGAGQLLRPLLGFSRAQLEEYARAQQLQWIEDESNEDERFERNYLRSRVTPVLQSRWPLRERVARASANLQEAAELLQELGEQDLRRADLRRERFGGSADLDAVLQLSVSRQKNLLRSWLARSGGTMPQAVHLQQALDQLATAAEDSQLAVKLGGLAVRRYRNRAYLTPELPAPELAETLQWDGSESLQLPGSWQLAPSSGWPQGEYRVCLRGGGERARPAGRRHSQTLKKLLQELELEPWLRDRVPLIYRGEELLAVGDLFVCGEDMGMLAPPRWRYRGIRSGVLYGPGDGPDDGSGDGFGN